MHRYITLLLLLLSVSVQGYQIPQATVQALKPRGLRISIPDEPGIQLFAVHVNINKAIKNPDAGQVYQDTVHAKDGRWMIEVPQTRIKVGDTIHYWMYVQAHGQPYTADGHSFKVTELIDPKQTISPVEPTTPPCHNTITTVNGKTSCRGKLIFEETFDTLSINKWRHDIQFADYPDYEFVVYADDDQNSFVSGGKLHVMPTLLTESGVDIYRGTLHLDRCTKEESGMLCSRVGAGWNILPPVQSARLTTKSAFSFRYGRIEIQAKLPSGDWLFPELWLEPKSNVYGSKPLESGRIQLALARGNRNLVADGRDIGSQHLDVGCMISMDNQERREMFSNDGANSWSDAFHTYTIKWTPDNIVFSVDGRQIGQMAPPSGGFSTLPEFTQIQNVSWARGSKIAPFDQEFFLSIGLGVGGFQEFPDNCLSNNHPKPWENRNLKAMLMFWRDKDNWLPSWEGDASGLQVEYVQVWAI